ncbi:MAG: amidohydrolase family protein, partial [Rhodospirillales bacterium]|nr:amidohydrolase family protein [Rhodospirillales bacterium]
MAEYDLVIRGGTLVDGTGAPPQEADLGITAGRIAAIGPLGRGAEEIDAKGKLVTPGFVDIHTHYDAQAIWDDHLAPSSWHGVTTAVMGNCGVGFAPCKPADREKLIELMEGVEDIPGAVMREGLRWEWEDFPGYLAALERRQRDIDVCALLPHAAVRVYVMGERAIALENANQADIAQMREITRQAMLAGAFGFSTSRSLSHKTLKGDPTPTLRAQEDELAGIAMGMRDAGSGMLEIVSEWAPDHHAEFAMLRRVVEASGRPAVFSLAQRHSRPEVWRDLLAYADAAARDGVPIRPVVAPRAIGLLLGLSGSQNPFSGCRSYRAIAHLPLADRVQALRDPATRARITTEDPKEGNTFPLFHRMSWDFMFRFGNPGNYLPNKADSIAAMAAREGRTPQEIAYDLMLEDDVQAFIYMALGNYASGDLSMSETALDDRNCIMGLGDGGAHVAFILDAGFQTWMLTHWGKTRKRWDMPELIRRLTSDTAQAAGLHDRGVLAVGKKAD